VGFTLDTRSPTATTNNIVNTCTASYMAAGQPGPIPIVALFIVTDEESAKSHFQLVRGGYDESDLEYETVQSGSRELITAEIDREGPGRILATREGAGMVSIRRGNILVPPVVYGVVAGIEWNLAEGTLTNLRLLVVLVAIGLVACSGGANDIELESTAEPTPELAITPSALEDLLSFDTPVPVEDVSLAGDKIDPFTCDGALQRPELGFRLDSRSNTESARADNPAILSACSATYASAEDTGPFMTVGLFTFEDPSVAEAQLQLIRSAMAATGFQFEQAENASRGELILEANSNGIGVMILTTNDNAFVSVHNGPTEDATNLWSIPVMFATARDLARQLAARQ